MVRSISENLTFDVSSTSEPIERSMLALQVNPLATHTGGGTGVMAGACPPPPPGIPTLELYDLNPYPAEFIY